MRIIDEVFWCLIEVVPDTGFAIDLFITYAQESAVQKNNSCDLQTTVVYTIIGFVIVHTIV